MKKNNCIERSFHLNYSLMFNSLLYPHKCDLRGSLEVTSSFLGDETWHFPNQSLLLWPGSCKAHIFRGLKIIPHQEVLSTWPSPLWWRCAHSSNLCSREQIKWRNIALCVVFTSSSKFSSIQDNWEFSSLSSHECCSPFKFFVGGSPCSHLLS